MTEQRFRKVFLTRHSGSTAVTMWVADAATKKGLSCPIQSHRAEDYEVYCNTDCVWFTCAIDVPLPRIYCKGVPIAECVEERPEER